MTTKKPRARKPSTRGPGRPTQGDTPRDRTRNVRLDHQEDAALLHLQRRLGASSPSEAMRAAVRLANLAIDADVGTLAAEVQRLRAEVQRLTEAADRAGAPDLDDICDGDACPSCGYGPVTYHDGAASLWCRDCDWMETDV